jgi:hypothetical protein
MALFSNNYSKEFAYDSAVGNSDAGTALNPLAGSKSWTKTTFAQQGNSRIGANVAAGDIKGRFEYGTGINLRLLYGTWNFGSGEMSVGQMYNPTYYGLSNQVYDGDNGLAGFGAPFSRLDAIELKFGGFKIAFVEPSTTSAYDSVAVANAASLTAASKAAVGTAPLYNAKGVPLPAGYAAATNTFNKNAKVVLPKIELAYNGAFGPVNLHVSGGWNSVDFADAADNSKSVTSMVGQVMAKYSGGPFSVGGSFLYGSNLGNYGWNVGPAGMAKAVWTGTELKDTTTMGFTLVGAFTFSDMVGIEAGMGYTVNSFDKSVAPNDDPALAYYVQVPLTLADGVFIIPEVGVHDFMEAGDAAKTKEGNITYLGAKFQINF